MNSSLKKIGAGAGLAILADTALDIGSIGIVGGGFAIGVPVLALVGTATLIGVGLCALACEDDLQPKEVTDF